MDFLASLREWTSLKRNCYAGLSRARKKMNMSPKPKLNVLTRAVATNDNKT